MSQCIDFKGTGQGALTGVYVCVTTTQIMMRNLSFIPEIDLTSLSPLSPYPPPIPALTDEFGLSLDLP